MRQVTLLILLCLLAVACGARGTQGISVAPSPTSSATEPIGAPPPPSPTADVASAPEAANSDAPASPGQPEEAPAQGETPVTDQPSEEPAQPSAEAGGGTEVPLTVSVEPACAEPGGNVSITVSTVPRSLVALSVSYPDSHGDGEGTSDEADANGTFTFAFTVDPTSPPGRASVIAAVSAPPEWHGRTSRAVFGVADPVTGCP